MKITLQFLVAALFATASSAAVADLVSDKQAVFQRSQEDKSTQSVLLRTYRRHLEEMQGSMQQFRKETARDNPQVENQVSPAQSQLAKKSQTKLGKNTTNERPKICPKSVRT